MWGREGLKERKGELAVAYDATLGVFCDEKHLWPAYQVVKVEFHVVVFYQWIQIAERHAEEVCGNGSTDGGHFLWSWGELGVRWRRGLVELEL